MVPANESKSFNQYSPAPVQNNNPTTQHIKHTIPKNHKEEQLRKCLTTNPFLLSNFFFF